MKILSNNLTKKFYLVRTYKSASNPLQYLDQLCCNNIRYCGFTQDIYLRDDTSEYRMYLEPWILTQINPGGHIIMPFFGKHEYNDYYQSIDATDIKVSQRYAKLSVTGSKKFKIAYKSANTFGRMAYINKLDRNEYCLMIRNYYNDPSVPYCSEPWHDLGKRGSSVYFYNDDGINGGFAEVENTCSMVGLDAKNYETHSTTSLWFFIGSYDDLRMIINVMLGIKYK